MSNVGIKSDRRSMGNRDNMGNECKKGNRGNIVSMMCERDKKNMQYGSTCSMYIATHYVDTYMIVQCICNQFKR